MLKKTSNMMEEIHFINQRPSMMVFLIWFIR